MAVAQRLFDAINNGALDELPGLVAPDVVDHNAVIFMQPQGPGGVMEGIRMLLQGSRTSISRSRSSSPSWHRANHHGITYDRLGRY